MFSVSRKSSIHGDCCWPLCLLQIVTGAGLPLSASTSLAITILLLYREWKINACSFLGKCIHDYTALSLTSANYISSALPDSLSSKT